MPDDIVADIHYNVADEEQCITQIRKIHQAAFDIKNGTSDWQIVDARAAGRFNGEVPEPRPGLRSGHITGSKNLPFSELLNEDGTLKSELELSMIFEAKGIDTNRPIINSCGSGMTACVVDLALKTVGAEKTILYDGSWTEYVSSNSRFIFCRVLSTSLTSARVTGMLQVRISDYLVFMM